MIKTKRTIAYIALFLFVTLSPPLEATHPNNYNSDSHDYTNSYLIKALNLTHISPIVIDYISGENENFTSLLDLTIILKYHQHTEQMMHKADGKEAALRISAKYGHLDFVRYLVEQGADINDSNKDGYTALIWSAYNGHIDCVKYLVQQGADINAKNEYGDTALILSACWGHLEIVKYLVEQVADINAKNQYGDTALILSACWGHLEIVKYLVEQGADINAKGYGGQTALIQSTKRGHLACANYLREQGDK